MLVGRFCDLWTKPGWLTLCYAKLTGFWPMWAVCMAQHKNWMHSRIIISNDIKHIEPFPYIHKMYFFTFSTSEYLRDSVEQFLGKQTLYNTKENGPHYPLVPNHTAHTVCFLLWVFFNLPTSIAGGRIPAPNCATEAFTSRHITHHSWLRTIVWYVYLYVM